MFFYQTPAISGSVAICAVLRRRAAPPSPLRPALPVSPLPLTALHRNNPSSSGGKDTIQGCLSDIITFNYGLKEANKSVCGKTPPTPPRSVHKNHLTQLRFSTCGGVYSLLENACLFLLWTHGFQRLCVETLACPVWFHVADSTV